MINWRMGTYKKTDKEIEQQQSKIPTNNNTNNIKNITKPLKINEKPLKKEQHINKKDKKDKNKDKLLKLQVNVLKIQLKEYKKREKYIKKQEKYIKKQEKYIKKQEAELKNKKEYRKDIFNFLKDLYIGNDGDDSGEPYFERYVFTNNYYNNYSNNYTKANLFKLKTINDVINDKVDDNGNTLLIYACAYGSILIVKWLLLSKDINVNLPNNNNITPLHVAYQYKHDSIFKLLVRKNANLNVLSKDEIKIAKKFLMSDGKIYDNYKFNNITCDNIILPYYYGDGDDTLYDMYKFKEMYIINRHSNIYNLNNDNIFKMFNELLLNMNDKSIYHYDTYETYTKYLNLITLKDIIDNKIDDNGNTLLHYACRFGFSYVVGYLLKFNPDINIKNKFEKTPIMIASEHNFTNIVNLLLKYKNVEFDEEYIEMCRKIKYKFNDLLKWDYTNDNNNNDNDDDFDKNKINEVNNIKENYYISNDSDNDSDSDSSDSDSSDSDSSDSDSSDSDSYNDEEEVETTNKDIKTTKEEVENYPTKDILDDSVNKMKNVILMLNKLLTKNNNDDDDEEEEEEEEKEVETVKEEVETNNVINTSDFIYCEDEDNYENIVEELNKANNNTEEYYLIPENIYDNKGNMIEVENNITESLNDIILNYDDTIESDDVSSNCDSIIDEINYVDLTASLSTKNKINTFDKNGKTMLMYSCINGHIEVVKTLLNNGANVNQENSDGMTALMYACENGHDSIVKLLLTWINN
jgi:ankyrin repeat protein